MMKEFLQHLDSISIKSPGADLNWPKRLKMYKQIELITGRITFLENPSY